MYFLRLGLGWGWEVPSSESSTIAFTTVATVDNNISAPSSDEDDKTNLSYESLELEESIGG
ncbi:hypothetical protein HanRHA438_Chr16g0755351 [Helianthus annuus]|nr:hypothetical protein HanRHA438_Chr16g0755351 [Helianthus annuus]